MPRIARVVISGVPHHCTQKCNYGQIVFTNDEDRELYLSLIHEYSNLNKSEIWAYCLLNNHVHFIVLPLKADSLANTFKSVHIRYLIF